MAVTRSGEMDVEVRIVADPEGEPALLLQLPDGFILIKHPNEARDLASVIIEGADALEIMQKGSQ